MPWIPKTDFEEEIVNLQPDHDFVYGTLSEPQYTYPRPQAHIEYAVKKKEKKLEKENDPTNSKINEKLKVITEVQRMASTKPLGEQPTIDDWDDNAKIEQEMVGMMRYHGLTTSVEQPLNENATISTFPVENSIKVVKNGRKKVAYFFDDKVFELKQKVSDSSSGFESCKANNSPVSEVDNNGSLTDTSFNTSTSSSPHTFNTCNNSGLTNSLAATSEYKSSMNQESFDLNVQSSRQYEKLLEDTASLSLSCSSAATAGSSNSFKSTEENENWETLTDDYDVDNILKNCEDWPHLVKNKSDICNLSTSSDSSSSKRPIDSDNISTTDVNTNSSKDGMNFLERFIDPEYLERPTSSAKKSTCELITYASVAKDAANSKKSKPKSSEKLIATDFVPLYSPRKVYALKRRGK